MKKLFSVLSLFFLTFAFCACDKDEYTIIVSVSPECTSMGTVTGGGTFKNGSSTTISAIPNAGYIFVKWDDGNTEAVRNITVSKDRTYLAYFSSQGIPNDEIWYTSADGTVISPNDANTINARIISNTYSNGIGIIKFDANVTTIGEKAFYKCPFVTITLPNSLLSIGAEAFGKCEKLLSVTIGNSVMSIDQSAFEKCSCAKELIYSEGTKKVLQTGLTSIEKVTIPNSVISIGNKAFWYCEMLASVNIPLNVTNIEDDAFCGCKSLASITIPASVVSIGENAFYGCKHLNAITVLQGNPIYDSRGNCNAIIKTATNTLMKGSNNTVIPSSVTNIGKYAFAGLSSLDYIYIPNSVTSIKESAFYNCTSLTSIAIPSSVTNIEYHAFGSCSGLTSVKVYWNNPISIMQATFEPCQSMTLYVPAGTRSKYLSATWWKYFGSIVEMTN